jgi:hypothetical protein
MIRIWRAYSCNNSGSYRLIARFVDATTAATAGAELATVLAELAASAPENPDDAGRSMLLLAQQYGLTWEDEGWGSAEDGPHVVVEGETVFVHHRYCLGLGPGIPKYLEERGAKVEKEEWGDLQLSLLFRAPVDNARFDDDFAILLAQPTDSTNYKDPMFRAPWSPVDRRGRAAFFRDAGTVGMHFPTDPSEIAVVKSWLAGHDIEIAAMRFDEPADVQLFTMLAAARCTSCGGALEYLDPRLHDIETPQLVCKPCGGLYELAAFAHT